MKTLKQAQTSYGSPEALEEAMENGELCVICWEDFTEDYGYPLACSGCGGEGVLAGREDDDT